MTDGKQTHEQRVVELITANNRLVEDVRYWKARYTEEQTRSEIILAGAVSSDEKAQHQITLLEREIEELKSNDT